MHSHISAQIGVATLLLGLVAAPSDTRADEFNILDYEGVLLEVEDLRDDPDSGLLADKVYFMFHDGQFNLFDFGKPAGEGLQWFANHGYIDKLVEEAVATGFQDLFFEQITLDVPTFNGANRVRPLPGPLVNRKARYVSFFTRFYPTDDTIAANEDPMRYEVFGEDGHFLGPIVIDIYGSDLIDPGTKENLEENLIGLDRHLFDDRGHPDDTPPAGKPVRPHPGFNGSYRNPDGTPVRLMAGGETYCQDTAAGEWCHEHDPDSIDFTKPGSPLMRLRITALREKFHGAWSGSYRNPLRSGEGFNFEFFDESPPRALFYWYTYQPDGSGDPLFLVGEGHLNDWNTFVFDIYETHGGLMASTQNPDLVERIPWGTATVSTVGNLYGIPACRHLLILLNPYYELDLDLPPSGRDGYQYEYAVSRLTPDLTRMDKYCGRHSGVNIVPFP